MIKKILIPVDFSESSLNALETAVTIAASNKAALLVFHVTERTTGTGLHDDTGIAMSSIVENSLQILSAITGSITQKNDIAAEVIHQEGYVGPLIVEAVSKNKCDLVVMGAHGASGYRELFTGSNTYFVTKHATCPVLSIPEGQKWHHFKHVLFPVRTTYGLLNRCWFMWHLLKGQPNCTIELLSLSVEKASDDTEVLHRLLHDLKAKVKNDQTTLALSFSHDKNVAREIMERADQCKADLVVVCPSVDIVNKQFFIGPFSQRILNHSKVPVLSILRMMER